MPDYRQHLMDAILNHECFFDELYSNVACLLKRSGAVEESLSFQNEKGKPLVMTDFANVADQNVAELIKLLELSGSTLNFLKQNSTVANEEIQDFFWRWVFYKDEGIGGWYMDGEMEFAMLIGDVVPRGFACPKLQISTYRELLVKSVITLEWYLQEVHRDIVNLGMYGDWADVNEVLENNSIRFFFNDFESMDDQNIQELLRLFWSVDESCNKLININAITEDEHSVFIREPEDGYVKFDFDEEEFEVVRQEHEKLSSRKDQGKSLLEQRLEWLIPNSKTPDDLPCDQGFELPCKKNDKGQL